LEQIEHYHHRRDLLGEQDSCRCGQRMPCDALILQGEILELRKALAELTEQHLLECQTDAT
jgi:hypothetical protein